MTASSALNTILGKTGLTDEQLRRVGVSVIGGDSPARSGGPVSDSPQLLRAALDYAKRGWLVIPLHSPTARGCSCGRADCQSVGKHPRTAHGSKDASRDPATIRAWWKKWPDANVGIATGPESGLLVLDVDGAQGEQSLIDLAQRGFTLPDSYTVRTGSGGQHLYFDWPEGADVRNSARKIAPGLDIRGVGGLVAAPPSLHKSGRRYEVNESATDPAPCPEGLLSLIREAQGPQTQQSAPAAGAVVSEPIRAGNRTPILSSLIGKLHSKGVPKESILESALSLNRTFEPPHSEAKVRNMVRDMCGRYQAGNAPESESAIRKPELICLANVQARDVDWLWAPFIPARMLSMISGDPGAGKSFIALAVCADLSRGRLRDGRIVDPAASLYLSIENPIAETIRPRFDLLDGDASRFFVLKGTLFAEDGEEQRGAVTLADIPILDAAIVETGARLIVVDPIQSYLGANVDLHRSNETRPVLDGLSKLAESHGCAILLLRHLSKQSGGKAIHRGLGSIDLTGAVRSEMLAGALPDDPEARALVHIKSNVGRMGRTLGYSIDGEGRFSWTGESPITASDLLAQPDAPESQGAKQEAEEWLRDYLSDGSKDVKDLRAAAKAVGIKFRTLQRAKDALRVRSSKAAFSGQWFWFLPATEPGSEAVQ